MQNWKDLKRFCEAAGFFVTSTTGGRHNAQSKHFLGLAVDVRTRDRTDDEIKLFLLKCSTLGVRVRDERTRPAKQRVWSGAHLHLEICADTMQRVREFQTRNNLIADGIAGAKTLAALEKFYAKN